MKFCQNCGKLMENHETYCNECGMDENQIEETQEVEAKKPEENGAERDPSLQNAVYTPRPYEPYGEIRGEGEERLPTIQKVLFVLLPFLIPLIGCIVSLVFGILFMNKKSSDYRNFGLIILVISILAFLLQIFLCCVLGAFIMDEFYYYYYW